MNKDRRIHLGLALTLACLTAILSGSAVYWMQHQAFQSDLQSKTAQIEQLNLDVTDLRARIEVLNTELEKTVLNPPSEINQEKRVVIQEKADLILFALKNKDTELLGQWVHPQKGLRMTPYSNINTATDVRFPGKDIPDLFYDETIYHWGVYDGSGEPMDLTFSEYYEKYIYDQDFLAAPQIVFDQVLQRGNLINNFKDAYPQGVSIEYHFPGFDPQYGGMDWRSLKLVFEQDGTDWYLTGIIHEEWTI